MVDLLSALEGDVNETVARNVVHTQCYSFESGNVGNGMKFFHANVVFSAVIVWFAMPALGEGVLSMGTPSVDGTNVTVPVYLQGDINEGVAALDFTLQYDPSVLAPNGVRAG